jgi:MFS family permease
MRAGKAATWARWRSDVGVTGVWVAGATLVAYWGLTIVSFLLRALNDPTTDVADAVLTRLGWGAYPTVGAVIVARRPGNRIGWLCCAIGLLLGPAFFAQDYAWYALVHKPGSLPGGLAMGWLGLWPWYVVLGLLSFVLLLFPSGQLASRRWRPVAWVAAAATAAIGLSAAFEPRPLEGLGSAEVINPLGIQGAEAVFEVLGTVVAALGVVMILAAASMVGRFRRARGDERQQLKWFAAAAVLSVLVWLAFIVPQVADRAPLAVRIVIASTWLLAVPVAIGVAMLRYRLYDIDRLINRAVVYGLLTALLGAVYAGGVLVFGQLFGGIGAQPPSWVIAGATLAAAAVFRPARRRIQAAVDRRFNRRRYHAAKTIEAFSARLRDEIDLDTLSAEVLAVAEQTMEPTVLSLWLRPPMERSGRLTH